MKFIKICGIPRNIMTGKFAVLNMHIQKAERTKINNLGFLLRELVKEQQVKPLINKKRKIIQN